MTRWLFRLNHTTHQKVLFLCDRFSIVKSATAFFKAWV